MGISSVCGCTGDRAPWEFRALSKLRTLQGKDGTTGACCNGPSNLDLCEAGGDLGDHCRNESETDLEDLTGDSSSLSRSRECVQQTEHDAS